MTETLVPTRDLHLEAAQRGLARVWIDFESQLTQVPLITRLLGGRLRLEDYLALLHDLRQQVIDGGRWISRAASNLSHEELRSLFIQHAAAEHRDYRLLEDNYVAAGGEREIIRAGVKNVGSEALSAFMFHSASQPEPIGLLGAMFIIEGLGQRLAGPWALAIQAQLGLDDAAVSFFRYHAANDAEHLGMFERALGLAVSGPDSVETIVRHARVVARLYRLQLEEVQHV